MKKLTLLNIFILLMIMKISMQAQVQIIPKPQESEILKGSFTFTQRISFEADSVSDLLKDYFNNYFTEKYGIEFSGNKGESRFNRIKN